jgi:Tol biopolymer transport system component
MAVLAGSLLSRAAEEKPSPLAEDGAKHEAALLSNIRQLTFEGARSGEGYFSADGKSIVFQSEREPGNPFYQIYMMDLETGDTARISPGTGKTTCAWIRPDAKAVLFASTHDDTETKAKQDAELADRQAGKQKRYAWDYDENYDIYEKDLATGKLTNLTHTRGYDAEGCYSPDGKHIVFASNRAAYTGGMSKEDAAIFEHDKSYMMDIYIMDADGSNVKQLTNTPGYDGGPFFSHDGNKICWRRFSKDGATAEIFTMNADGSDQKQLTHLGAMSWAPFFHPSGDYLIFATNKHGFGNFELYLVDAAGTKEPARVTYTDGFDGLPCFSPDGKKLAWTSNRTPQKKSQIFIADWNDSMARQLLAGNPVAITASVTVEVERSATNLSPEITAADLRTHITTLASDAFEGRLTGTPGEQKATQYVASHFRAFGLVPAGENGSYFQPFNFTAGVNVGDHNALTAGDHAYTINKDWRPLAFSKTGEFAAAPIAFAGYGFVAPKSDEVDEYDSYVHADVKGKWVMVLRYVPEGIDAKQRQTLARYGSLRHKAMIARDHGAAGLIVVSGPNSKVKDQLVPLAFDAALAGTGIPAVSVTDNVAAAWLKSAGKDLKQLHDTLDKGDLVMAFDIPGVKLSASIDLKQDKRTGRNVIGRLQAGDKPADDVVVVGAHVDHLGRGSHAGGGSSLARKGEEDKIHYGADDNASGTAAMMEIAQYLADLKAKGKLAMKHDVLFCAWSGEELGLLGSSNFVKHFSHDKDESKSLRPPIVAYLNMDMVGRLRDKLTLQGMGTSSAWAKLVEQANAPVGLAINAQHEAYLPTDSTSFYFRGVPILNAFTGAHAEYHTPRDTPDTINYEGAQKVAKFMALVTRALAIRDGEPDYIAIKPPKQGERRGGLRAYLGTIPDYAQTDVKGVKLSGVAKDGPADKAGVRGGDVITELAGKKIENIYDYTYAIEALKIDQPTKIVIQRGDETKTLEVTPKSRE